MRQPRYVIRPLPYGAMDPCVRWRACDDPGILIGSHFATRDGIFHGRMRGLEIQWR